MILEIDSPQADDVLRKLEERRRDAAANAFRVADEAIAGVRARGDAFVAEQIAKYDGVDVEPGEILWGGSQWSAGALAGAKSSLEAAALPRRRAGEGAGSSTETGLQNAIDVAISRIEAFHRAQLPRGYVWTTGDTSIEHRVRPLRRVGIYVPGGRAVYLSTLIMCAVPARLAGVPEIVVATTPAAAARPELQSACALLGISAIYRAGGAAGVAALALGTGTLERVDKIVGPGNSYVTAAKTRLVGEVGIDMTAGPTELVIIADDSGEPSSIAADLMAQAEHGPDSAVILITPSAALAREVETAAPGAYVFVGSIDAAVAFTNRIAPEHLSIQARNAADIAQRAENCGAIYVGRASAPAAGDYSIGSNHVLPTAGTARFFSPLGVYDFVKRTNVVTAGAEDAASMAPLANAIAQFEGLPLHGASAMVRA